MCLCRVTLSKDKISHMMQISNMIMYVVVVVVVVGVVFAFSLGVC